MKNNSTPNNDRSASSHTETIKSILKRMKKIRSGKKVAIDSTVHQFKSIEAKYSALLSEYTKCSDEQLDLIEVQLKSDLASYRRLHEYGAIIPLFVSLVALIISYLIPLFVETVTSSTDIATMIEKMSINVTIVSIIAVVMFYLLHGMYSSCTHASEYLLSVLEKHKEKRTKTSLSSECSKTKECVRKTHCRNWRNITNKHIN